ncbi:MAG: hypothetical protein AAGA77_18695 [Bacteroidota bacterium]
MPDFNLRVMTWNLRKFGSNKPTEDAKEAYEETIKKIEPDIILIQEIQMKGPKSPGGDVSIETRLPTDVKESVDVLAQITNIVLTLNEPMYYYLSGANSAEERSMTDCYAIFFKKEIMNDDGEIITLRAIESDKGIQIVDDFVTPYPNDTRRPGLIDIEIRRGNTLSTTLRLLTVHAAYRQSSKSMFLAINGLSQSEKIGGTRWTRNHYYFPYYTVEQKNTENLTTIFVGDFNSNDQIVLGQITNKYVKNISEHIYSFPCNNYLYCETPPRAGTGTTYKIFKIDETDPNKISLTENSSRYDKIFFLRDSKNKDLIKIINEKNGKVFDFINYMVKLNVDAPDQEELGELFKNYYRQQEGKKGLSDHAPYYSDFTIETPI